MEYEAGGCSRARGAGLTVFLQLRPMEGSKRIRPQVRSVMLTADVAGNGDLWAKVPFASIEQQIALLSLATAPRD